MTISRRERIEEMLKNEPNDQFLRYSLAMEVGKDDSEKSIEMLHQLTLDEQPLISAFFMAAQNLEKLDRISEARSYLRDGIEIARKQGDSHAAGEMSEMLASLGRHGE